MPDVGLDKMRRFVVPLAGGVLQLLVHGVAVGVFLAGRCVADGIDVTHWLISATGELFSEDDGVEFWPWTVEGTELPPWENCVLPTSTEKRLFAGGS